MGKLLIIFMLVVFANCSEEHNVLVSRFFSMVKDQRDRLNKLRVLGDDCIWGEEGPDRGMEFCDRMAQDAEKMADAMMEVIKDMCRHFNGRTDVDDRLFYIDWVPDYSEEERFAYHWPLHPGW